MTVHLQAKPLPMTPEKQSVSLEPRAHKSVSANKEGNAAETKSPRLRQMLKRLPLLRDFYEYFWVFPRIKKGGMHRGIFESFDAAAAACPEGKPSGYNQDFIADQADPARFTAGMEIGRFDSRDYPILYWLGRAFEDSATVFDLGGNVGLAYYAYRNFMRYPPSLRWVICEIPEVCRAGRRLAAERGCQDLEFTEDFSRGESADILLTCGALQYIKRPLADLVSALKHKPRHILIQRVPLSDQPTFFTLENISYAYCPYRIQNQRELFDSLAVQGYRLIATWRDFKQCRIPFYPGRTVDGYQGAYLQLQSC